MAKKQKVPKNNSTLQTRLGNTVRSHRQQLGITQEELAWRADMHRTYLADIERGVRNITLRSIANLARALQLTVEGLLFHASGAGELLALPAVEASPVEILLVEDNPLDIELTLRAFKQVNFTNSLHVVRDGEEALEYLFHTGRHAARTGGMPQLVLLDLDLPKVSGLEVLRQIQANKATRPIPVVVLTVSRDDENIIVSSRLGASHYIIKPVEFDSFAKITSKLDFHWTMKQTAVTKP